MDCPQGHQWHDTVAGRICAACLLEAPGEPIAPDAPDDPKHADLIAEYIGRMPASLSNVQSHFGLSRVDAFAHLAALEAQGRIRRRGAAPLWRTA